MMFEKIISADMFKVVRFESFFRINSVEIKSPREILNWISKQELKTIKENKFKSIKKGVFLIRGYEDETGKNGIDNSDRHGAVIKMFKEKVDVVEKEDAAVVLEILSKKGLRAIVVKAKDLKALKLIGGDKEVVGVGKRSTPLSKITKNGVTMVEVLDELLKEAGYVSVDYGMVGSGEDDNSILGAYFGVKS